MSNYRRRSGGGRRQDGRGKEEEQAQEQKAIASVHPAVKKLSTNPEYRLTNINAVIVIHQ